MASKAAAEASAGNPMDVSSFNCNRKAAENTAASEADSESRPGLALKLIRRSCGRCGFGSSSGQHAVPTNSPQLFQRFGKPRLSLPLARLPPASAQALSLTPNWPRKHRSLADELFPAIFRRRTTAERADSGRQPLSCHQSWQKNLHQSMPAAAIAYENAPMLILELSRQEVDKGRRKTATSEKGMHRPRHSRSTPPAGGLCDTLLRNGHTGPSSPVAVALLLCPLLC